VNGRRFCAAAIVTETADMIVLKCLHIYEPGNKNQKTKMWFTIKLREEYMQKMFELLQLLKQLLSHLSTFQKIED
jgi:hypothetical protein